MYEKTNNLELKYISIGILKLILKSKKTFMQIIILNIP